MDLKQNKNYTFDVLYLKNWLKTLIKPKTCQIFVTFLKILFIFVNLQI